MNKSDRLIAGLCIAWLMALIWIANDKMPLNIGWEALGALSTTAAVIVALWSAQSGERRQRKRDEAVLHVAIISIANTATILEQLQAQVYSGSSLRELAACYMELGSIDVPTAGLSGLILAELPSPSAVDHVLAARHALDVTARQLRAVASGGDAELLFAQIIDLRECEDALRQELRR